MKIIEKILLVSGTIVLTTGFVQCGNTPTNNTNTDMAVAMDLATTSASAPSISALTPTLASNAGGSILTIAGSNFVAGATVTIGGQSCANPVVTPTQIKCTVPAKAATCGLQPVVVTNPDKQLATNSTGFAYSTSALTFGAASPTTQTVGMGPRRMLLVDLNKDGNPELVTANNSSSNVTVLKGNGDGTFTAAAGSPLATANITTLQDIVAADVDGDGNMDLIVVNSAGTASVTVYLGNGDTTFKAGKSTAVPAAVTAPASLAAADFTGDSKADVVIGSSNSANIGVFKSNGDGTFTAQATKTAAASVNGIALADVNGDTKLDIVNTNNNNTVGVLLGNQDGTFATTVNAGAVGTLPVGVVVADVTGDGKPDILTANRGAAATNNVSVLANTGNNTWATAANVTVGNAPEILAVADLNGDGILDIVAASLGANAWYYLTGTGQGSFASTAIMVPTNPAQMTLAIAVADINKDKLPDVVAGSTGAGTTAHVFTQQCK